MAAAVFLINESNLYRGDNEGLLRTDLVRNLAHSSFFWCVSDTGTCRFLRKER